MPLTRPKAHQIVTTKQEIEDPLIEINAGATGANTNDLGIVINRGSSGNNVGIIWDRSLQKFVLVQTTADGDSTGDLVFTQYADLEVDDLTANTISGSTIDGGTFDGTP